MKKMLSILLILCLTFALLPAVPAAAADVPVTAISISGIDHPQPGGAQDLTADVSLDAENALYETKITWYDIADEFSFIGTEMAEGETFTLGHRVYASIRITLAPGFSFRRSGNYFDGEVDFYGWNKSVMKLETDEDGRAYLNVSSLPYQVTDDVKVTSIRVQDLSRGEVDALPDVEYSVVTEPADVIREATVDWYRDSSYVDPNTPLEAGVYRAALHLYFKEGYYAADPEFAYDGDLNVDGAEVDWASGTGGSEAAMWIELKPEVVGLYTLRFSAGEGSGKMDSITLHNTSEAVAPEPTFTPPSGRSFDHWSYQKGSAVKTVQAGGLIPALDLTGKELILTAVYSDRVVTDLAVRDLPLPVPEQAVDLTANVSSSPYAINRFTIKVENADPELETTGKYQVGQTYLYTMTFGLKSGFAPLRYETDGKVNYVGTVTVPDGFKVLPERPVVRNSDGTWTVTLYAEAKCRFVDVKETDWFDEAVDWAVQNNVTKGKDKTHFAPYNVCTRAEAVTFLWRALDCPEPEDTTNPFKDVKPGSYYYDAVLWAVEKGITKGKDKTHFAPSSVCTREQVVTFLWRAYDCPEPETTTNPFQDVKSTSYAYKAILWAVEKQITNGTSKTKFSPAKECNRAQIVTFLYRAETK